MSLLRVPEPSATLAEQFVGHWIGLAQHCFVKTAHAWIRSHYGPQHDLLSEIEPLSMDQVLICCCGARAKVIMSSVFDDGKPIAFAVTFQPIEKAGAQAGAGP